LNDKLTLLFELRQARRIRSHFQKHNIPQKYNLPTPKYVVLKSCEVMFQFLIFSQLLKPKFGPSWSLYKEWNNNLGVRAMVAENSVGLATNIIFTTVLMSLLTIHYPEQDFSVWSMRSGRFGLSRFGLNRFGLAVSGWLFRSRYFCT